MYAHLTHSQQPLFVYLRTHYSGWLKILLRSGLFICAACVVIILIQLVYPSSRALPLASVQGKRVGGQSIGQLQGYFKTLDDHALVIQTEQHTYPTDFQSIGITVNATAMANKATNYPTKLRFVPLSIVWHRPNIVTLDLIVDDQQLTGFVQKVTEENFRAPINAQVSIEGSEVKVTPGVAGRSYDRDQFLLELRQADIVSNATVHVTATQTPPTLTTEKAQQTAELARQRINTPLVLRSEGQAVRLDAAELAAALRFHAQDDNLAVDYDRAAITAALGRLARAVYIAPKTEVINLYDGVETTRSAGAYGRTVAVESSVDPVIQALGRGESSLELKSVQVAFGRQYNRDYSRSSHGLQVLINDWTAANGTNFSVTLKSTDGSVAANYNQDRQFASASLYKLFVSYSIGQRLHNGSLQWSDTTETGQSVEVCLELMIVVSSNTCGHALGSIVGWGSANGALQAKGFGGTALDSLVTRPSDAALFLQLLYAHSLVDSSFDANILDKLGRQVYRKGIPAGIPGVHVKNKVGYVDSYTHDAAIVYNPRGTYILVVMSNYGSYPKIADLSAKINAIMSK